MRGASEDDAWVLREGLDAAGRMVDGSLTLFRCAVEDSVLLVIYCKDLLLKEDELLKPIG